MKSVPVLCIQVDEYIQLRLHEERYAEAFYALTEKNRAHLRVWEPWADQEGSLEGSRGFIRQSLHDFAEQRGFQTGIWYQGQLVGAIGLHHTSQSDRRSEIGYWIDQDMQGKGIVTRAARGLISYAFGHYGLNRLEIHCVANNTRSRAVAERLGFTLEGVRRRDELLHGQFVDVVIYGLLASEWRE